MKLHTIIQKFETLIPLDYQEPWDRCGLQLGSKNGDINKVVFALDCCHEVIRFAQEEKAQLIVTHHPLSMNDFRNLDLDTYEGWMIEKCIQNQIAIYCSHTNHDASPQSLSRHQAKQLKLKSIKPLAPKLEINPNIGSGAWGVLPQAQTLQQLIPTLKKIFGLDQLTYSGNLHHPIKTIALCNGSGTSLLPQVIAGKIDLFITGDVKYHYAIEALRENTVLIDVSHFDSEVESATLLASVFKKLFDNKLKLKVYSGLKNPLQRA